MIRHLWCIIAHHRYWRLIKVPGRHKIFGIYRCAKCGEEHIDKVKP